MTAGDISLDYGAQVQPTFALASLASSAALLAGYETSWVNNDSTTNWIDYIISGKVTVGTTPTASTRIEIWAVAQMEDTPAYPDVFDGTAGAETLTSEGIKQGLLTLVAILNVDATTSDRTYPFGGISLRSLFGGNIPKRFGFFVTHNTGVNLNSTAGNHELNLMPVRENVEPGV